MEEQKQRDREGMKKKVAVEEMNNWRRKTKKWRKWKTDEERQWNGENEEHWRRKGKTRS